MSGQQLKLFVDAQFMSPYAMSAFVALREKGIAFDLHEVDLDASEQLGPDYLARSLTGRVPTLIEADWALSESSAITEYLEELFPPPRFPAIYPADPRARARARQVQAWLRSDLMPIREERTTAVIFRKPSERPLSQSAQAAAQKLFNFARALLERDRTTLFGEWCIADTELALMINRLVANGDEVPPQLAAFVRHQWQRASVQAWVGLSRGKARASA